MKLKNIILSSIVLTSSIFANSDCVCFKLEGEFGKELKELIEKHQGSLPKVQTKSTEGNSGGFSIFTVEEKAVKTTKDIVADGKNIYQNKCSFCHGQNAELAGSGTSKAPSSLSEEQINDALISYQRDEDFGGSMRIIMSQYTNTLSKDEMKAVAKYIKSLK
jgi:mono/diheme cytochrome c family protein